MLIGCSHQERELLEFLPHLGNHCHYRRHCVHFLRRSSIWISDGWFHHGLHWTSLDHPAWSLYLYARSRSPSRGEEPWNDARRPYLYRLGRRSHEHVCPRVSVGMCTPKGYVRSNLTAAAIVFRFPHNLLTNNKVSARPHHRHYAANDWRWLYHFDLGWIWIRSVAQH